MESCYARQKVSQFQSSFTRLSISKVSFLTDAIMRTIGVGTVRISITNMTAIVAFINICEHNRFAKGNWIEEKQSWPVSRITRQLFVMNSYSAIRIYITIMASITAFIDI